MMSEQESLYMCNKVNSTENFVTKFCLLALQKLAQWCFCVLCVCEMSFSLFLHTKLHWMCVYVCVMYNFVV